MKLKLNKIYHADNATFTPKIPNGSLDVILEDPPYLYLKNQKLDRLFDELAHFTECYRMLRKGGFIVIFGRGESFYRWNTILADLGFTFKEEIIWDKAYCSSPLMAISRVHETASIWSKGKAAINKVKVPYLEMKRHDIPSICQDIKRLRSVLNNTKSLDAVLAFLENNQVSYGDNPTTKHRVSTVGAYRCTDRCAIALNAICEGMTEKSIIKQVREHYNTIHPTQKPPRLLERLLALVIPPNKPAGEIVVADFFGGSCNTAKACITMGVNYIVTEIDKEFYDKGVENVEKFKEGFNLKLDF